MALCEEDGKEVSCLKWGDYLAIALYFIAVIAVGLWVSLTI